MGLAAYFSGIFGLVLFGTIPTFKSQDFMAASKMSDAMHYQYQDLAQRLVGAYSWPHSYLSAHWSSPGSGQPGEAVQIQCMCRTAATVNGVFSDVFASGSRDGDVVFEVQGGIATFWLDQNAVDPALHFEMDATGHWLGGATEFISNGTEVVFHYSGVGNESFMSITDSWTASGVARTIGRGIHTGRSCDFAQQCRTPCAYSQQYQNWDQVCATTSGRLTYDLVA